MDREYGIVVRHLYKSFGRERVLENVNLKIEPGHIYGIVGNNGSGKTVLMKCICGFIRPDKGSVYVDGIQIGKERDFPESLGVIIETPGFIPNISGYRNLKLLSELRGLIGKKEIFETLRLVGLDPYMKKHVAKYSLGMRQRLGLAQAIMENPRTLILDEPFNGLDKQGVKHMHGIIKELKNQGKAILLASHSSLDIEELCDDVHDMEEVWDEI